MSLEQFQAEEQSRIQPAVTPNVITYADTGYKMTIGDSLILLDTTDGAITLYLPPVGPAVGRLFSFRMTTRGGSNDVTLEDAGDEPLFTHLTFNLAADSTLLYSDGLIWHKLASIGSV